MSEKKEIIIGSLIMGLVVIALEIFAWYTYTGSLPWNV